MKTKAVVVAGVALGLALAACRQQPQENVAANVPADNVDATTGDSNVLANAGEAVAEPAASSPEAAVAALKDYAGLAARREFAKAAEHWTDASAAAQFAADLDDYPNIAMTVGKAGNMEGAAGSSYISIPLTLDLTLRSGAPYEMRCKAVLRRVNDVPGATAKQLRWNIQSIDC